jgi:hypothetical protein
MQLLLEQGADPYIEVAGRDFKTALEAARGGNRYEAEQLLLDWIRSHPRA